VWCGPASGYDVPAAVRYHRCRKAELVLEPMAAMDAIVQLNTALAGRYELEREIGAGGMATVYLARDLKHKRRVAVKVLKAELGIVLGPERFLAEIQVTANLQHPNLLPLFDSGEAEGLLFYVMPFVDGETLRDRIDREKQLPVDEALQIAIAVASALDYAHAHGVIHRDLKPENILLQAGQPIVADFGIALAVSKAGGQRVTQSGLSLGTPQYMSPEQATGDRVIDARADIYSLGAVIYEMLTGEPPHAAPTAQAVIAKLLTEEARSIAALRRAVPEHVDEAVRRALEKLPADRFTSARSFADALQGKLFVPRTRTHTAVRPAQRHKLVAGGSIAVAVLAVAAMVVVWRSAKSTAEGAPTTRVRLAFQGDAKYASGGSIRVAVSPDGTQLAYVGGGAVERIYIKRLADLEPTPLAGAEGVNPQFSPDGKWIAFLSAGTLSLKKILLPGGVAVTIADSVNRFTWGDGDVVVVTRINARRESLSLARASGGPITLLATPDTTLGERNYTWPHLLPGSKAALFNIQHGESRDSTEVAAIRLSDRSIVRFGLRGLNPRYVSTGHILFSHTNGAVMAAPFDVKELKVGTPVQVFDNVRIRGQGATQYAVSEGGNGTVLYVEEQPPTQLVVADRAGHVRVLIPDTVRLPGPPRFSPDGKRIAVPHGAPPIEANIWIYDLGTRAVTQLTTDNRSVMPTWTADSRRLTWTTGWISGGARWQPWDGSEPATQLLDSAAAVQFSPTGRFLTAVGVGGRFLMMLDSSRRRLPLVGPDAPGGGNSGSVVSISPDGKWLAYSLRGSAAAATEIYVQPLPGPGGRHKISADGGTEPVWGATSTELFFRKRGWLWSATIATSPEFTVIRRDSLFAMNAPVADFAAMYDVARDGNSFLMPWFKGEQNPPPVLVENWFTELRQRMAAAKAR
jgi:tRNA A-37 threonylcarbamoyl transferase component Bud32